MNRHVYNSGSCINQLNEKRKAAHGEVRRNDNYKCKNNVMHVTLRKCNEKLETTLLHAKKH